MLLLTIRDSDPERIEHPLFVSADPTLIDEVVKLAFSRLRAESHQSAAPPVSILRRPKPGDPSDEPS